MILENSAFNLEEILKEIRIVPDDSSTLLEEKAYLDTTSEKAFKTEELKSRKEYNQLLKQNRKERKKYARLIFRLTCIWTLVIFVIIIANGLTSIANHKYFEFHLSDSLLITLITSTTLNFFGFFLLVVKYLFNSNDVNFQPTRKSEKIKK
jgi:hypothetical protein